MMGESVVRSLLPEHEVMLRDESGLPDDVIAERGYWSATQFSEVRRLGFSERQSIVPALVVPLWNVDGEQAGYQIRPNTPRVGDNGRVLKYETPKSGRAMLDVPPRCRARLADPSVPVWITEGSKKADALPARGVCAVSLSGVWNWRGTNDLGGTMTLSDWDSIALNERLVRIVFDSDVARKRSVALAMQRLAAFLERRQAVVEIVYLPDEATGGKQGIDDFVAAGGSVEQLEEYVSTKVVVPPADMKDGLPEIVTNGRHLPVISEECWQVLVAQNDKTPMVFKRAEALVRVARAEERAFLAELTDDGLRFVMERWARFVTIGPPDSGYARRPGRMPRDVVDDMLVSWRKPVPNLRGVIRTPVFSREGRLSIVQGYQPETELYYRAAGDGVTEVPERPAASDLTRGVKRRRRHHLPWMLMTQPGWCSSLAMTRM
jgi:hypothetical protein